MYYPELIYFSCYLEVHGLDLKMPWRKGSDCVPSEASNFPYLLLWQLTKHIACGAYNRFYRCFVRDGRTVTAGIEAADKND